MQYNSNSQKKDRKRRTQLQVMFRYLQLSNTIYCTGLNRVTYPYIYIYSHMKLDIMFEYIIDILAHCMLF